MSARDDEHQILDAIETQLRSEDPELTAVFVAFTSVTRDTEMPLAERLSDRRRLISRWRRWRTGQLNNTLVIQLVILTAVWMLVVGLVVSAL